jgi:uroporphyrinogen-III decarboxylase
MVIVYKVRAGRYQEDSLTTGGFLPIHKEIAWQNGGPLILHVCGNCDDRLELFVGAGFDVYHFEWQMRPKNLVKKVKLKISLTGCINNAQTLYLGDTARCIRTSTGGNRSTGVDIIGPECARPLATPLENLKAIVSALTTQKGWT